MLISKFTKTTLLVFFICSALFSTAQYTNQTSSGFNVNDFYVNGNYASWGDMDNDGDLDLLRTGEPQPRVNRNDGANVFSTVQNLQTTGDGVHGGVWVDMDKDGFLDIVFTSYGNGLTPIYRNNGDGTFSIAKQFGRLHYGNLDVADIDLDGDMDIIACGSNWGASGTDHGTKIFRNDGGWVFTQVYANQVTHVFGTASSVAGYVRFADLTNDGLPDIVLAGSTTGSRTTGGCRTEVWRNTGSGFALLYSGVGVYNGRIDIGDSDSDGWLDFAVTGELDGAWSATGNLYHNNGDGTFTPSGISTKSNGSVMFGDYDSDGDLDLSLHGSGAQNGNQIYRNDGSNAFNATTEIPSGISGISGGTSTFGDYSGDGRLDMFTIGHSSGTPNYSLLRNTSTGQPNTTPTAPTTPVATVTGQDVELSWNAASDAQTAAAGLTYNVMVGNAPDGINVVAPNSDPSTGYRRITKVGNAWSNKFFKLKPGPGVYYWKVQAIDNSFAGSVFLDGGWFLVQPPAPSVTTPLNYCVGDVAPQLTATGAGLRWYDEPTGDTAKSSVTPLTVVPGTTNYYVSQVVNGVEGPRALISVIVNAIPGSPTYINPSYCMGDVTSPLVGFPSGGATLKWWGTNSTGGTSSGTAPTPSNTASTTYYVSQILNGCESSRSGIVVMVYPIPSAPTVTTPITYCQLASASALNATPSGGGEIRWWGTNSTGGTYSGAAPTPGTTTPGTTTYYVTQAVNGCESTPRTLINVNVNTAPAIISQPTNTTVCEGVSANYSVSATGTGLTYQWQLSTNGGATYITPSNGGIFSNVTTATLTVTPSSSASNGYLLRCIVSGTCSPAVTSNSALLTVNSRPFITSQPLSSTVCTGGNTSFEITAIGTGLTYQWQVSANSGSTYTNLTDGGVYSNVTSATLNLTGANVTHNGYYYRCIVNGTCTPSVTSTVGILTVNTPASIGSHPLSSSVCSGGNTSFSVSASGTGLSYQWQLSGDGGSTYNNLGSSGIYTGTNTPTLTLSGPASFENGIYYRCLVTGACNAITSNGAMLTVNDLPSVANHPVNATICSGGSTTFSIAGGGTSISYQWQYSTNGLTYTNITNGGVYSNATTAALNITGANASYNNYYYQCQVSNMCSPTVYSNPGILTINTSPSISLQPSAATICSGGNTSFAITATGTGLSYQWQISTDGGTTYNNLGSSGIYSGTATATLSISGASVLENGYSYRCQVSGTCTPIVYSNGVVLTVNTYPSITSASSGAICSGNAQNYSITSSIPGTTYSWSRAFVTGISNGAVTNQIASTITETLNNSTAGPLTVTYIITPTANACTGASFNYVVTVNSIPVAPTVTSTINYCLGQSATTLTASGTGLMNWYTVPTGGTALGAAPTPSTASAGLTNYYVSQTISGCEGPRANISVYVYSVPSAPSVVTPVDYCVGQSSTTLTASGTGLKWYNSLTSDTVLAAPTPSTTVALTKNYYVSQTISGCESPRANIAVNVYSVPTAPSVVSIVNYCVGQSATTLSATGTGLSWYTVSTGGTASGTAPTPSTAAAGTTNYYVSQTVNGCESPRANIAVNVYNVPSAPSVVTPVNYCVGQSATTLSATGTGLSWYTVSTGGTASGTAPMPSTTAAGTTNYYVSQTVSGCESSRSNIAVNVYNVPSSPSVVTPVNYCVGQSATALSAAGTGLSWYTVSTGGTASGTAPTPSTTTAGTTNYYVSQTISGCESPRANIAVNVYNVPSAPSVGTPVNYCVGQSATTLSATGTGLSWYTVSTGGTALGSAPTPSTATAGTTNYYVSQTISGCESPRASIAVNVYSIPTAPTVTSPINYCVGQTATALTASGTGTMNWYTVSTGGTALGAAPMPATTSAGITNYYVSQTLNGCEGSRSNIAVNVYNIPTGPTVNPISYCLGATASPLNATPTGGGTLLWWGTNSTGGTSSGAAPIPSISTVGSTNYYVTQTVNGCESTPRTTITVTVNALPAITADPVNSTICSGGSTNFSVTATGTSITYQWEVSIDNGTTYATINNSGIYSTATSASLTITGVTATQNNYLYRCRVNGICTPIAYSNPATLFVNSAPIITTPPANSTICLGGTTTFVVTVSSGLTYQWQNSSDGVTYTNVADGSIYSGSATATLTVTNPLSSYNGFRYRCVVGGTCASTATSSEGRLFINSPAVITTEPSSMNICPSGNASFSVAAAGSVSSYQWQVSTDAGTSYFDISNGGTYSSVNTASLLISNSTVGMNGYLFRCKVIGLCSPDALSNPATLTINSTPNITAQPSPTSVCENATANFSITATGSSLLYQWQESSNGTLYSDISGASSTSLSIVNVPSSKNGYYYRCIVTGSCGAPLASNGVILSITPLPSVANHPSVQTICAGSNTSFSVTAVGGVSYKWQVSSDNVTFSDLIDGGSYFNTSSSNMFIFGATTALNGNYYRCVVTGNCNPPSISNSALLTVNALTAISANPVSSSICSGENTSFSITASGSSLTYQWQESNDGGNTFNNISNGSIYSNVTTPTLTITGATNLINNYFYRCEVTSSACSAPLSSNKALLTVKSLPVITSTLAGNACSDVAQNYIITSSVSGTTYNWNRASVAGINNAAVSNQTSSVISEILTNTTFSPVNVTYVITPTALGCLGTDISYSVTVNAIPSVPVVADASFCHNSTATTLSATPDAGGILNWYGTNSVGGVASATATIPSTSTVGVGSYYVSQTVNGCESIRAVINVTIVPSPAAPTVATPGSYCVGATASALLATPSVTGILNWYGTDAIGGVSSSTATIPATTTAGTVNYYVSQADNGCESTRSPIPVTVNSIPVALGVTSLSYCQNITAVKLTATPSSGGTLNWYGTIASGGTASATAPTPATNVVGTVNYYVSQTVNGCESTRSSISVTTLLSISSPIVTSPVTYCQNATAMALNASAGNSTATLNWYGMNSTGGIASLTAPTPSTSTTGSFTYYVSEKAGGCESARIPISVIVDPTPVVNAGSDITINEGASVTLNASGNATNYSWNNGITNGVAFSPLSTSSGYYVLTGTLGNCNKKDSLVLIVLKPNLPEIAVYYQTQQYFSNVDEVNIGSATVTKGPFKYTFTINNQGFANLNIGNILVSGSNVSSFSIDQTNLQSLLTPNVSTTFDLIFQPLDTGAVSVKLTILNDDQDESSYEIEIKGYSPRIVPVLTFLPIGDVEYGSPAFGMTAYASNAKPVAFTTSTPALVSLVGNTLTPLVLGDVTVTSSVEGDNIYEPVSVLQTFKIKLPAFGLLGSDYLAKNIVTSYMVYPTRSQFIYKWTYDGDDLNFTSDTTGTQIEVYAGNTTVNGNLKCSVYNSTGDILGVIEKPIVINNKKSEVLSLTELGCSPAVSDIDSCYMKQVELEDLVSISTYNSSGISDFTQSDISTELFLGETYSGKVNIHGAEANRAIGVWIDFNNDGEFEQEDYVFGDYRSDTVVDLTNIRIPNMEANVGHRRLRVKVREAQAYTYSESCVENGEKGETEDYIVNLKSRLDILGSEFMSLNGDGKNECFIIRGVNPRSQVRTLKIFDVMGNVVYNSDFYENDWCGIAMDGNGKGKLVPKGTYYYIFQTEGAMLKSFIEITY